MPIRVLIADHRMDQLMLLAEFLLRRGVSAATCTDGGQARDAIASHCAAGEPYDLVIAHVDLPDLPGLRVLYEARRQHLETVAAISCPHQRRDDKVETMIRKVGVSAVLDQPFDLMQVDGLIKRVLKSRGADEPQATRAEVSRTQAVVYRDEQAAESAGLPSIDGSDGPPRPSPTGNTRRDDDIALPALGGGASADPPIAKPAPVANPIEPSGESYTRRASAFYTEGGDLLNDAGYQGRESGGGHRRRSSQEVATPPPAAGGGQDPRYSRRNSGEFFDERSQQRDHTTGYTRRHSSEFFDATAARPGNTTRRIRRSLSGGFGPAPDQNIDTTCIHCGKPLSVKASDKPMDVPCMACGGMNRIIPPARS